MAQFKDLAIGQTFDFINDENRMFNSFYDRCVKVSTRKYQSLSGGLEMRVGSTGCTVHHVGSIEPEILAAIGINVRA